MRTVFVFVQALKILGVVLEHYVFSLPTSLDVWVGEDEEGVAK